MIIAGLTGSYGMGKSTVLSLFGEFGAAVLDSDRIVSDLLNDPGIIRKVLKITGKEAATEDGSLDKQVIAQKIFAAPKLRKSLEALLHPLVMKTIDEQIRKLRGRKAVVIVEVPLLFEGGYEGRFDRTIAVFTTIATAMDRLGKAGITRKSARARLRAQMPIAMKKKRADFLIDNNGPKRLTKKQVEEIYLLLKKEAGRTLRGPRS